MKEHKQTTDTLKHLAQTDSEKLHAADDASLAALAVWRVTETRNAIIRSGGFSNPMIERLDQLAEAYADTGAEACAQDAAARFQAGVFDPDEDVDQSSDPVKDDQNKTPKK